MSCINTIVLFRSCSKIFYLVTSNVCTCRRSLSRSTLWWLSREAEAKTNPVTTHLEDVDPATTQWRQQPAARCFWLLRWHLSAIDVVFFFFGHVLLPVDLYLMRSLDVDLNWCIDVDLNQSMYDVNVFFSKILFAGGGGSLRGASKKNRFSQTNVDLPAKVDDFRISLIAHRTSGRS